jgi:hypothetical protein
MESKGCSKFLKISVEYPSSTFASWYIKKSLADETPDDSFLSFNILKNNLELFESFMEENEIVDEFSPLTHQQEVIANFVKGSRDDVFFFIFNEFFISILGFFSGDDIKIQHEHYPTRSQHPRRFQNAQQRGHKFLYGTYQLFHPLSQPTTCLNRCSQPKFFLCRASSCQLKLPIHFLWRVPLVPFCTPGVGHKCSCWSYIFFGPSTPLRSWL